MNISAIPIAVQALKNGDFVIVLDDRNRENEGDLLLAAEHITTQKMAFLVRHSSGYLCVAMDSKRADALKLDRMVAESNSTDRLGTAYTVSVDVAKGTSTGISAHDRALTVKALADPRSQAADFLRPGHVLSLRAKDGGVLTRRGHTEAAVDLCRLASLQPVGVIGELVRDSDGLMARMDDCLEFASQHGLHVITVADLHAYRSEELAKLD